MNRAIFSSDEFPAELSDDARLALWRDIHDGIYCGIDLYRPEDRPFSIRFEFAQFGPVSVGKFEGTVRRMVRRREAVTHDANDDFSFGVNCGPAPLSVIQPRGETLLERGGGILTSNDDIGDVRGGSENGWYAVNIPRKYVEELVVHPQDRLGGSLDAASESMRHLARYLGILSGPDAAISDPRLAASIGATLVDLVALALGAIGDAAEVSRLRGLRAARLQQIVAAIRTGYLTPDFSPRSVAAELRLSPRYIQDILHETEASFGERVLELRLQHARSMLASRRHDATKMIDIAYASGFSDVSYFNRQFRRRFGASPTQMRG